MNKQRIIVLDMDGSLLDDNKKISQKSVNFLKKVQAYSYKIVLASGRPFRAVKPYYEQLGLDTLVICYNGAVIYNPQTSKFLYKKTYPREYILNIVETIGESNFENIVVEDFNHLEYLEKNDVLNVFAHAYDMKITYGDFKTNLPKEPLSCVFALKDKKDVPLFIKLGANKKHRNINVRFWNGTLLAETYFSDINKYTSLLKVLEYYNIPIENSICFGDGDNDLEMVSQAGIGVAMKNSTSKFLKQSADMLTLEDNNHDGITETLKVLIPEVNDEVYFYN